MLLDALAALGVLEKQGERYQVPGELGGCGLTAGDLSPHDLASDGHSRGWGMLAWTVQAGIPAPRPASIRGAEADTAGSSRRCTRPPVRWPMAWWPGLDHPPLLSAGRRRSLGHLDSGLLAGSARYQGGHLRPAPRDRPGPARFAGTEFADRVTFIPGDFYQDELPRGSDLAWVGAIVHQNSRPQNCCAVRGKVDLGRLNPGGLIGIRDFVMDPTASGRWRAPCSRSTC